MTAPRLACLLALTAVAALAGAQRAAGVVGGRPLPVRDAPWTVVIRLSWSLKEHCTGVLIGPANVLTAAHCLYGYWGPRTPATLTVTAGVSNYLTRSRGTRRRRGRWPPTACTQATATATSPTTSQC